MDRFYSGRLTTEDSLRAAQTRQALTVEMEGLNRQIEDLTFEKEQLALENERLEQENDMISEELSGLKLQIQRTSLNPMNQRCKAFLVQTFVHTAGYLLMELGNDFNKYAGLKSFLLTCFGVDIKDDLNFRVDKPSWVLGQVVIKSVLNKALKHLQTKNHGPLKKGETSSHIDFDLFYWFLKTFHVNLAVSYPDTCDMFLITAMVEQVEKIGSGMFNIDKYNTLNSIYYNQ